MRKQPIEIHVRLKDPRVIAYYKSLGAIDTSRSKHFEELLGMGLDKIHEMTEVSPEERSKKLPTIDMYFKRRIMGIDVSAAYKHGMISDTQLNYIYRGAQDLISEIERDDNCRECVPSLRDQDF